VTDQVIPRYFGLVEVVESVIVREEVFGSTSPWLNTLCEQTDRERGQICRVTRQILVVNLVVAAKSKLYS
jgi:hypothetical protein